MPTAKIRKSGNSTVLVLPPYYLKERGFEVGQDVGFELFRKESLKKLLGRGKHLKIDAQKVKDELRKEW
ncbi:hypothetical protein HYV80_02990 [Candidatus Woesearchaeota archaeon]|nr:hypothetical protein [Candidatus Woesearchaeota archaeon]